jgi:Rrf2 family protein
LKFSTKTRYGVRTMIEIALHSQEKGVYQKDIAANQEISVKYLDHIIHALKTARLVLNVRGKKSGYILSRKPSEITVYDIHNAFEPGICIVECLSGGVPCNREEKCNTKNFWQDLNEHIETYLKSVTLEDLIETNRTLPPGPLP